ncbi:MAG: substrate-binding domain-containing protein [Gammaproteobacteria bacterium]|nr:substrate-binding domain-containing protein [Gammaproteobacteria bacterium]MDH5800673.1 substrate-binding domain-containing protein [Gammaproteobacteria bacterium]
MFSRFCRIAFVLLLILNVNIAHSAPEGKTTTKQFVVGFAQDTLSIDWRARQVNEVKQALATHPNVQFIVKDAGGHTEQQIRDVESLVNEGIDLLITSPRDAQSLAPIISKTYLKGIPVILLSRKVNTEDYTTFIGPDDVAIGVKAARRLANKLNGKGKIIMLSGIPTTTTAMERAIGFRNGLIAFPGLQIVAEKYANYQRSDAIQAMEGIIESGVRFDAIYAQSDSMATGARMALLQAGIKPSSKQIIGGDYIKEARQAIRIGEQDATFTYPTGGKEGALFALKILNGKKVPKHVALPSVIVDKSNVDSIEPIF